MYRERSGMPKPVLIQIVLCTTLCLLSMCAIAGPEVIWQEAESMGQTGKWSNDPQHIDLMGSPYLLATGLGKPVEDAVTTLKVPRAGTYTLWVRCRDWFPSHSPGQFQVLVNGKAAATIFGKLADDAWQWVKGGEFELPGGDVELRLHDTTGWWGRCDAIVLATDTFKPADDKDELARQRLKYGGVSYEIKDMGSFDVVVVGGGPAGMGAAIAAARNGITVAFIQDRPVLGGNSSSEIQVPPMGYIGNPPDLENVTGITAELFPKQGWKNYADSDHMEKIVRAEEKITLYLNTRGIGVEMSGKTRIQSVIAQDVRSGRRMRFRAPLFIDTTGHGWIGFYAGAEYRQGTEARSEFGETLAPEKARGNTMGDTLYKMSFKTETNETTFTTPDWAYQWKSPTDFESHRCVRHSKADRPKDYDYTTPGKGRFEGGEINHNFSIEYGGMLNTIDDSEKIRDELFRINIGLWGYSKNYDPKSIERNKNRRLVWLNYVSGVRESRRIMGDYIMTQKDWDEQIVHEDTIAFTDWGIDDHHPLGFWVKKDIPDTLHIYAGRRTSIPYRSLVSKDIDNLWVAGRCMSVSHLAMGGIRVMRPLCATGQAAGTAAAIATRYRTTPRGVYQNHIKELQDKLIKDGCRLMDKKGGMREPTRSADR